MSRNHDFGVGEYYHVYARGVEKRDIFLDETDCYRFQRMLFICNSTKNVVYKTIQGLTLDEIERKDKRVAIGAYCLMSNHFHLLIKEITEGGISAYMQKLITGYSMYFNKKNERTGRLFEGSYKSKHAASDTYLKYLYSYIHLNPVSLIEPNWRENGIENKDTVFNFLKSYQYSSFPDYIGENREENLIVDCDEFPQYFKTAADKLNELEDWLTYEPEYFIQGLTLDN